MPFPYGNHELGGVDLFLFNTLAANATLVALLAVQPPLPSGPAPPAIFFELAPEGAIEPFVLMTFLSSPDRNVVGNDARAFTRPLYLCRAVTRGGSFAPGETIAAQIDTSLLGARGNLPAANISVMGCFREEMIRYVEVDQGVRFEHTGGRYRAFVSALN